MQQIRLNENKCVLVDDSDYEWLNQWKWSWNETGYAHRKIGGRKKSKTILMHRLIMDAPKGMEIDHINGDKLDNRRENLRIVTHALNLRNTKLRSDNTTGFRGVRLKKDCQRVRPYQAYIVHKGKQINIGYFHTAIEAATAYNKKSQALYGEYIRRLEA